MLLFAGGFAQASDGAPSEPTLHPAWPLLGRLRADAAHRWSKGHCVSAILALEHACRIVIREKVSEEGGHDHAIGQYIERLAEGGRWNLLRYIFRHPKHFPQGSGWAREALAERRRRLAKVGGGARHGR